MVKYNASYIFITWAPPQYPNGVVNYTVKVQERNLLTDAIADVQSESTAAMELLLRYEIRAYHEYNISVTSQTSAGPGEAVMESFLTPEESTYCCYCIFSLVPRPSVGNSHLKSKEVT